MLADARLRPLIDEFMLGANDIDAERRAGIYRLAWDFIGSALGSRNELYERNYLASAKIEPDRTTHDLRGSRSAVRTGRRDVGVTPSCSRE